MPLGIGQSEDIKGRPDVIDSVESVDKLTLTNDDIALLFGSGFFVGIDKNMATVRTLQHLTQQLQNDSLSISVRNFGGENIFESLISSILSSVQNRKKEDVAQRRSQSSEFVPLVLKNATVYHLKKSIVEEIQYRVSSYEDELRKSLFEGEIFVDDTPNGSQQREGPQQQQLHSFGQLIEDFPVFCGRSRRDLPVELKSIDGETSALGHLQLQFSYCGMVAPGTEQVGVKFVFIYAKHQTRSAQAVWCKLDGRWVAQESLLEYYIRNDYVNPLGSQPYWSVTWNPPARLDLFAPNQDQNNVDADPNMTNFLRNLRVKSLHHLVALLESRQSKESRAELKIPLLEGEDLQFRSLFFDSVSEREYFLSIIEGLEIFMKARAQTDSFSDSHPVSGSKLFAAQNPYMSQAKEFRDILMRLSFRSSLMERMNNKANKEDFSKFEPLYWSEFELLALFRPEVEDKQILQDDEKLLDLYEEVKKSRSEEGGGSEMISKDKNTDTGHVKKKVMELYIGVKGDTL